MRINLKPLSVNQAWQGTRTKTKKYRQFERDMLLCLPKLNQTFSKRLEVKLHYGFSSKLSDIDNPCKLILDCLCKKYGFDDRYIFKLVQTKEIVDKGKEFLTFNIKNQ